MVGEEKSCTGKSVSAAIELPAELNVQRHGVEALTCTIGTRHGPRVARLRVARLRGARLPPGALFAALFGIELLQLQTGTEAAFAPAMFRVEREQPGVEFGKARAASSGRRVWWRRRSPPPHRRRCTPRRCPCSNARVEGLP